MKELKWLLIKLFIGLTISLTLGLLFFENTTFSSLDSIISALQNTSAMVFAIAGIWLAYLYPEAVAGLIKGENLKLENDRAKAKKIESIVGIVVVSALVMIGIIVFYLANAFFINTDLYINNKSCFKLFSVTYIIFLAIIQIYCVALVIKRSISFINQLYKMISDKKVDKLL